MASGQHQKAFLRQVARSNSHLLLDLLWLRTPSLTAFSWPTAAAPLLEARWLQAASRQRGTAAMRSFLLIRRPPPQAACPKRRAQRELLLILSHLVRNTSASTQREEKAHQGEVQQPT